MGLVYLFFALTILSIIGHIYAMKNDYPYISIICILGIVIFTSVAIGFSVDFSKSDEIDTVNRTMTQYETLSTQIRSYEASSENFIAINKLYNDCIELDKYIEKHSRLHTSWWVGKNYTEKIGNLPLLTPQFNEKFISHKNAPNLRMKIEDE